MKRYDDEAWGSYYDSLEKWEADMENHHADNWEDFVDIDDVAEYLGIGNGDEACKVVDSLMRLSGFKGSDCSLQFLKKFLNTLDAELISGALMEIVISSKGDYMRECWEDDNPKPLSPDQLYDIYCEEQWEDSR